MIARFARALNRLDAIWAHCEVAALTLLTAAMLALGLTQVVLRNAWSYGLEGGDQVLRLLVLWVGLLGASLATRHGQHISVDALGRFARGPAKRILSGLVRLAAAAVCLLLLLAALDYLMMQEVLPQLFGAPGAVDRGPLQMLMDGDFELTGLASWRDFRPPLDARLNGLAFPLALMAMTGRFALGALHDALGLDYGHAAEAPAA